MSWDDDFGRPVEGGGEYARPESLNGHLVLVFPIGYIEHMQTRFSQPGKKSDAVCCDIVDLDDKDEMGELGKVYRSSNLMQAQLILGLRPFIGKKVLGRIGKGVGKQGMNPPWVITDMSGDAEARGRFRAWAAAHPDFVVSTFSPRSDTPLVSPEFSNPSAAQPTYQPQAQTVRQFVTEQRATPAMHNPHAVPVAGVPGSAGVTPEELSMLARMRAEAAEKQRQIEAQFGSEPPF
jgi:hypothetical protein